MYLDVTTAMNCQQPGTLGEVQRRGTHLDATTAMNCRQPGTLGVAQNEKSF